LAAQLCVQSGTQERRRDAFYGDVADDEAKAPLAEIQEVVVVAADFARLHAKARILKRLERGQSLREETGLDLLGDFDFLRGAAFGFQLLGKGAALRFDRVSHFVETHQRKGIA